MTVLAKASSILTDGSTDLGGMSYHHALDV
jgi:hypothetical protein